MVKRNLILILTIFLILGTVATASDLIIDSKIQSYNEKENKINFKDNVKVTLDDVNIHSDQADITLTKDNKLDTATFYDKPYAYQVQNNKKQEVKANILKMSLITKVIKAEGDAQTIISDGKTPLAVITADTQIYDTKTNVMTALGGVIIKYQDLDTFSDKAVIKTNNKGDLKKIDLYGHAKIKEKVHNATADHFMYDTVKEEIFAEGNTMSHTEMEDGKPLTIKARFQQYTKKDNVFTSGGNVQVWFDDYYAKGPKLSVFPDKKTNQFNEIYFSGRSMINQNDKTIYADKIKMILKPKDFVAEGNTRTVIKNIKSLSVTEDNSKKQNEEDEEE